MKHLIRLFTFLSFFYCVSCKEVEMLDMKIVGRAVVKLVSLSTPFDKGFLGITFYILDEEDNVYSINLQPASRVYMNGDGTGYLENVDIIGDKAVERIQRVNGIEVGNITPGNKVHIHLYDDARQFNRVGMSDIVLETDNTTIFTSYMETYSRILRYRAGINTAFREDMRYIMAKEFAKDMDLDKSGDQPEYMAIHFTKSSKDVLTKFE